MAEAQSTALQIVQTQQNLVGKAIVGGASAVTGESAESKSQTGILEQLRDISLKTFRATTKVAETLANTLSFQKNKDAREKDQAAELREMYLCLPCMTSILNPVLDLTDLPRKEGF